MTEHTPEQSGVAPGYETRDVNIRALAWFAGGITSGTAIVLVALWLLLNSLEQQARRSDPPVSPLAAPQSLPPAPRLQETPVPDYQQLRAQQEQTLHSYGWVNEQTGTVRIPIERAIELLVEQPQRAVPPPLDQKEQPR